MALIVVGGQTKHVGKTTLVCAIIRHFVSAQWTAAKITAHIHDAEDCVPVMVGAGWQICEQRDGDSNVDTLRYLKAGAVHALLVCSEPGSLAVACSVFKREICSMSNVIVESTAAAQLLSPDLFLFVMNPESQDLKDSAAKHIARADALIVFSRAKDIDHSVGVSVFQISESGLDSELTKMLEKRLRELGS